MALRPGRVPFGKMACLVFASFSWACRGQTPEAQPTPLPERPAFHIHLGGSSGIGTLRGRASSGALELLPTVTSTFPAARLILDPQKRFLYATAVGSGVAPYLQAGFRIGREGSLEPLAEPIFPDHFAADGVIHPSGGWLFAHNRLDSLATYRIDAATGRLTLVAGSVVRLPRRDDPKDAFYGLRSSVLADIVVDPLGEYVYVLRDLYFTSCMVAGPCISSFFVLGECWVLRVDPETEILEPTPSTPTSASGWASYGRIDPGLIGLDPAGRFVYLKTCPGYVHRLNRLDGSLSPIAPSTACAGTAIGAHSGQRLLVMASSIGPTFSGATLIAPRRGVVSVSAIDDAGVVSDIGPPTDFGRVDGYSLGVDEHRLLFHPSGRVAYCRAAWSGPSPNDSSTHIWALGIDPQTGALQVPTMPARALSGSWSTWVLVPE
jgi:hypothetical protein